MEKTGLVRLFPNKNSNGWFFEELSAPVHLVWEITWFCNHKCIFCYNSKNLNKSFNFSISEIEGILQECEQIGVKSISVSGGEPFTVKEKLKYLINSAKAKGIKIGINTNGSLINKKDLAFLSDVGLLVSVHGFKNHKKITGKSDLNKILKNIQMLKDNGINVKIDFVATPENINEFDSVWHYFNKHKIQVFLTRKINSALSFEQDSKVEDFLKELKSKFMKYNCASLECFPFCFFENNEYLPTARCAAGLTNCVLGANKKLRPCPNSSFEAGNVIKMGLKKSWNELSPWRKNLRLSTQCYTCFYVENCRGGCRVESHTRSGDYFKVNDPLMGKPFSNDFFKLYRKYQKKKPIFKVNGFRREKFGLLLFNKHKTAAIFNGDLALIPKQKHIVPALKQNILHLEKQGILTNSTQIKCVVFDVGNTLFDVSDFENIDFEVGFDFAHSKFGISFSKYVRAFKKAKKKTSSLRPKERHSKPLFSKMVFDELSISVSNKVCTGIERKEFLKKLNSIVLNKNAINILEYLKKRKIIIAIISDGSHKRTIEYCKKLGIINYFQIILTTEKLNLEKKDAAIYKSFLELINKDKKILAEECLVVGDSIDDMVAKLAGMKTCIYNPAGKKINFIRDYEIKDLSNIKKII